MYNCMASGQSERGGFEPPVPFGHARFPSVDLNPLGHLSLLLLKYNILFRLFLQERSIVLSAVCRFQSQWYRVL